MIPLSVPVLHLECGCLPCLDQKLLQLKLSIRSNSQIMKLKFTHDNLKYPAQHFSHALSSCAVQNITHVRALIRWRLCWPMGLCKGSSYFPLFGDVNKWTVCVVLYMWCAVVNTKFVYIFSFAWGCDYMDCLCGVVHVVCSSKHEICVHTCMK
jgi:hypothetical protein